MTYDVIMSGARAAPARIFFCDYKGLWTECLVPDRRGTDAAAMQGCAAAQPRRFCQAVEQALQRVKSGAIGGAGYLLEKGGQRAQADFARRRGQRLGIQQ